MLGDTGSNVVGAVAGLWLVLTLSTRPASRSPLALLVLITVYGEFRSINALVERTPGLRHLDSIGKDRTVPDAPRQQTRLHLRHRRRRLVPRQGDRRRLDRAPARRARPQRSACRSSTRTSTSIPGTMSPYQHGEVFVTEDGAETDLDLGHYERFTDANTTARVERHGGRHLQRGHPPRAPRRLPRRDRPGRPAHHRRDQARASS